MKQILKINTMFAEPQLHNGAANPVQNFRDTPHRRSFSRSYLTACSIVCGCGDLGRATLFLYQYVMFLLMPQPVKNYSVGNNSTYSVTPKVSDITTSSIQHLISHLANLPKSSHITINVHTIIGDNNVQKVNS